MAEIFKYFHTSCLRNKVIYILTLLFLFRVLRLNRSKQDSKVAFLLIIQSHVPEKEINLLRAILFFGNYDSISSSKRLRKHLDHNRTDNSLKYFSPNKIFYFYIRINRHERIKPPRVSDLKQRIGNVLIHVIDFDGFPKIWGRILEFYIKNLLLFRNVIIKLLKINGNII